MRPTWEEYFSRIALITAERSNCCRLQTGAILVKDNRIISTGYNGTPPGIRNCSDGGCPRCNSKHESGDNLDECFCCHAEENAIIQAAYIGTSTKDSILYCTHLPCLLCTKAIISAGIKVVNYINEYPAPHTKELLRKASICLHKMS